MMESIENGIQLLLTGLCAGVSIARALRTQRREWALLGLFSGAYFLGDLYWLLYLVFYGDTTPFPLIPDLCWYASELFLLLLLVFVNGSHSEEMKNRALWLSAVFPVCMCVFYMQWGQYISNLIYAVLMTLILRRVAGGFLSLPGNPKAQSGRGLYLAVILFCALEYGLWTISCFWEGDTVLNPYFWLDILLSVSFLLFLPAVRKVVEG